MLPTNFGLETVITKEKWASKTGNWTAEECLKEMEDNKELVFGMARQDLLEAVGAYGLCRGEETENILKIYLEMAGYLPDQAVFISDDTLIHEGGVFCDLALLSSMEDYLIKKSQWGDDVSFTGFPGAEGNGLAFLAVNCYGINSCSAHKEEAWSFIENFFTEAWKKDVTPNFMYFSADRRVLEEQLRESMEVNYYQDESGRLVKVPFYGYIMNGEKVDVYPAEREDVDELMELVEGARLMRRGDSAVADIIQEGASEYLQGGKGLEEVVAVINNRLAVYYLETKSQ